MQKLVLNVPLRQKADPYCTTEVAVEKVIGLPTHEFALLQNHPQWDNPMIAQNISYMWMDGKQAHWVLFWDNESGDGIFCNLCARIMICVYRKGAIPMGFIKS